MATRATLLVPGGKKEENMKREKLKPSWLG
jgi:hypothetical protein